MESLLRDYILLKDISLGALCVRCFENKERSERSGLKKHENSYE